MKKGYYIILALIGIFVLAIVISNLSGIKDTSTQDQIVVIPINGIISTSSSGSLFTSSGVDVDSVLNELKKVKEDSSIKAVILEINSPGGTVVASKEIADAVKNLGKPSVAVIREVGASGAYWIASSTNFIIADQLSITGSVGVIGSYLQFSDIMKQYGITYERLVGGQYKDVGSPYKDLQPAERNILQGKIDIIHEYFINEVKTNRKLTDTTKISTGEFFLGADAKDLGLIDEFGNIDTGIEEAKKLANIKSASIVEFKEKHSLLDLLQITSTNSFYSMGQGIGSELKPQEPVLQLNAL